MSGEIKYSPGYNIFTIASDIKYFISSGFQTLPFTLAGTLLILGFYTANYAALFFLIGYLLIVPTGTFLVNLLGNFIPGHDNPLLFPKQSNNCNAVTSHPTISPPESAFAPVDSLVTYWMSMFAFFIGYMFTNAWTIYNAPVNMPANSDGSTTTDPAVIAATKSKAMFRESQSLVGMVVILLIALVFIIIRLAVTRCDSPLGLALSIPFGFLGWWWYNQLAAVGNNRLSDLFGIANRLMTPQSLEGGPYACIAGNNAFQYSS
jgi:hypothetical protein